MDTVWLGKSKAKVHFVTHNEGQTGAYVCSSTVSLTSAPDGGWVVNPTPRPIYTRERNQVPIVQEAGLAPGPVWTGAKNLAAHQDSISGPPLWSESLHQRRCPGSHLSRYMTNKEKKSLSAWWLGEENDVMTGKIIRKIDGKIARVRGTTWIWNKSGTRKELRWEKN